MGYGGTISYEEVLQEEWGTFTVSLDMEATVDGECEGTSGSEVLNITVEMSGEQMVEVRAEGFQGDYPWSGTHEFAFSFSWSSLSSFFSAAFSCSCSDILSVSFCHSIIPAAL